MAARRPPAAPQVGQCSRRPRGRARSPTAGSHLQPPQAPRGPPTAAPARPPAGPRTAGVQKFNFGRARSARVTVTVGGGGARGGDPRKCWLAPLATFFLACPPTHSFFPRSMGTTAGPRRRARPLPTWGAAALRRLATVRCAPRGLRTASTPRSLHTPPPPPPTTIPPAVLLAVALLLAAGCGCTSFAPLPLPGGALLGARLAAAAAALLCTVLALGGAARAARNSRGVAAVGAFMGLQGLARPARAGVQRRALH
jgi:hypothetical protein